VSNYINGHDYWIGENGAKFVTVTDVNHTHNWVNYVNTYDKFGHLEATHGLFDDKSQWFVDYDPYNQHNWFSFTTYVTKNAVLDYQVYVYDDGTKMVIDSDQNHQFNWTTQTTFYTAAGALDYQTGTYDNGRTWMTDWDNYNQFSWKSFTDLYSSTGKIISTTILNDDGTTTVVDWNHVHQVNGTSGNNILHGTSVVGGIEFMQGFAGNDVLYAGMGETRMEGGTGNDTYYITGFSDMIVEHPNEGIDTVYAPFSYVLGPNLENLVLTNNAVYGTGNALDNTLTGNNGHNVLSGEAGNDHLYGRGGNDLLVGGYGNDILIGGAGADELWGGPGADRFMYQNMSETGATMATADWIRDFSRAQGDVIDVHQIDANALVKGNQDFKFIGTHAFDAPGEIRYVHSGGETLIYFDTDSNGKPDAMIRIAGLWTPDKSWFVL
jgi:Ca2+-binding RTX toxin-like protein